MSELSLTRAILVSRAWQFARAEGVILASEIRFNIGGMILGSTHSNESEWRLIDGCLEVLDSLGSVTTRFDELGYNESGFLCLRGKYLGSEQDGVVHILTERTAFRSHDVAPRIAVLVRTHLVTDKLFNLLNILETGIGYDLFVCADETNGKLHVPRSNLLSHSTDMCAKIGLLPPRPNVQLLWYLGDYAFYCAHHVIPDYDYYVMIEYDVEFVRGNALALEGILRRLTDLPGDRYDLVGVQYGTRPPAWGWGRPYESRLNEIYGILFPFVVLSKRALTYLYDLRRQEAADPPTEDGPVFCEAFVPTELVLAAGFRCEDVNRLLPGCWDPTSFRVGAPMLENSLPPLARQIELIHPVFSEREYLRRMLEDARRSGHLHELMTTLSDPATLSLTPEVRTAFLSEVGQLLKATGISR